MSVTVLIVDDDKLTRETMARSLADGYHTMTSGSGDEALRMIAAGGVDVVLVDLCMPNMTGLALQEKINGLEQRPVVIFITGHGTVESAVLAMKLGAYDYITKPVNLDRLGLLIEKSLENRKLKEENLFLKKKIRENFAPTNLVGNSVVMQKIMQQLLQVSATSVSVLIEGETGTGKELLANIVHYNSSRAAGPFIKVNCGAFVENLLESELFGHEKGAFTGAVAARKGRFELADHGTLFLDEIAELPLPSQVMLLRFLQERTFERVGGSKTLKVDVRIIAATNKDFTELIRNGAFREDLFYRLCVVRVKVPPLRERKEDILPLIHHFIKYYSEIHNRPISGISTDMLDRMQSYHWPGNVRELMNCIESMVVTTTEPLISPETIPDYLPCGCSPSEQEAMDEGVLAQTERQLIMETLHQTGRDKAKTAKILGIGLRTLYRKIEKWHL